MGIAYNITKGARLRFIPELLPDPVLRRQIEQVVTNHDYVKAFCILSVKRGWFFSRKIITLCVVYNDAESFTKVQAELSKTLDAYCSQKPGFVDCMFFDWSDTEQRNFVEVLMAKIPFVKNNFLGSGAASKHSKLLD